MEFIDKFVDSIFSKLLLSRYKYDFIADPLKIYSRYKSSLDLVKQIYRTAYYWHGTGRYHYQYSGKSKYHSQSSDHTFDVLASLIQKRGLTPQYDFWTQMSSISLTKNRIYARAYAQFHQDEHVPLTYEYGTTKFWFYALGIKQVFTNNFLHNIAQIRNMQTNKDFNNRFTQWAQYVRRDRKRQPISLLSFYKLRSDIKDNHGILFGINKSSVKEKHYNPTVERYEVRSVNPITFSNMTHLEVPLMNIKETRKILHSAKINLPILPLELTEIYCNSLSYKYLAG